MSDDGTPHPNGNGSGDDADTDADGRPRTPPPVITGPRMSNIPGEQSRDFGHAVRRTFSRLRQERFHISGVVALAAVAVSMQVVGPKILGHATNIIVAGLQTGSWDFTGIHAWR